MTNPSGVAMKMSNVRLPPSLHTIITVRAKMEGIPAAVLIRRAICDYLGIDRDLYE